MNSRIAKEYCELMEIDLSTSPPWYLSWVTDIIEQARQEEPRITRGVHFCDWLSICDDDDDFDSFYGPDYFEETNCESHGSVEGRTA